MDLESKIADGYLLRGIHPIEEVTASLCKSRIPRVYKSSTKRTGLGEEAISGVSGRYMRVGGAQDLMVKGGWAKTDTVCVLWSGYALTRYTTLGVVNMHFYEQNL